MDDPQSPAKQPSLVRRGLGLLAIGGIGIIFWIFALALMANGTDNPVVQLIGIVGFFSTVIGVLGGLGMIAVGLLKG